MLLNGFIPLLLYFNTTNRNNMKRTLFTAIILTLIIPFVLGGQYALWVTYELK
jgi:glycopeptide antibiotics resistance protein